MRMENVESNAESSVLLNSSAVELDSAQTQNAIQFSAEGIREYRNALGKFSTGVAIVTAATIEGPIGITINSFASVSMNPALVLWSVAKDAGRHDVFKDASEFAIHVLSENQYQEAMHFVKNADNFDADCWHMQDGKPPLSNSALASFVCTLEVTYDGGDHTIVVGRVKRFSQRAGSPLVFSAGEFGTFQESSVKE